VKRCSRCGETKPYSEFHRFNRGDGRQVWCKACRKAYDHEYYLKTKTRWADNKIAWKLERNRWLRELKTGKPCSNCGGFFPPEAMQWDHRPGTIKLGEISKHVRNYSQATILAEIAKCDLVCATCHAIRTYNRLHNKLALGA
jgi:hypothetical protein